MKVNVFIIAAYIYTLWGIYKGEKNPKKFT